MPAPKLGSKGFYHKVRERLAWDHAIVAVATVIESSGGVVRDPHVVMGGVAPIPWRAAKPKRSCAARQLTMPTQSARAKSPWKVPSRSRTIVTKSE